MISIASRKGLKKKIKNGLVLLNGEKAKTGDYVHNNDRLTICENPNHIKKPLYEKKIDVLYEDEFLAIVVKPGGLLTSGNKKQLS